jgi:hypothetical protein
MWRKLELNSKINVCLSYLPEHKKISDNPAKLILTRHA